MGLSIRRYSQWLRMRAVPFFLAHGGTLTEAAHLAGYADAAHLSRSFRGMFGIPPSAFLRENRRVRIVFGPPPEAEGDPHGPFDAERWAEVRTHHGHTWDEAWPGAAERGSA